MINYIWIVMTLIGLVFAAINGTMKEVNEAIFNLQMKQLRSV